MDVIQCVLAAHFFPDDFRREFADYDTIVFFRFNKTGFYHTPVIGNAIIESKGMYWGKLGNISDTHPCQVGFAPISFFAVWLWDDGLSFSYKWEV